MINFGLRRISLRHTFKRLLDFNLHSQTLWLTTKYKFSGKTVPHSQSVFNRHSHWLHKKAAALLSNSEEYDYFRQEIAGRMISRLLDLERNHPKALDLGANSGQIYKELINYLKGNPNEKIPGGIEIFYQTDMCSEMLLRDEITSSQQSILPTIRQCIDDESSHLPFDDSSFDIVVTSMSLQWINDIPQTFAEVLRILKPDGAFIGAFTGGGTLQELRSALLLADQERRGGYGTHVSPMINVSDVGNLLSRSGFNFVTIDNEVIEIPYPDFFTGIEHLQSMGDGFCPLNAECTNFTQVRDVFIAAAAIYDEMYNESDRIAAEQRIDLNEALLSHNTQTQYIEEENDVKDVIFAKKVDVTADASLQVIFFMAWKPDVSQSKPLERGSQDVSFKDLEEISDIMDENATPDENKDDSKL